MRAKLALLVMKWRNTVTNWPQLARKHKLCTGIFPRGTDFHIKLISIVSTNQLSERRVTIKVNYSRKPLQKMRPAAAVRFAHPRKRERESESDSEREREREEGEIHTVKNERQKEKTETDRQTEEEKNPNQRQREGEKARKENKNKTKKHVKHILCYKME